MKKVYKVGGHCFSVNTSSIQVASLLDAMDNYKPFVYDTIDGLSSIFNLEIFMEDNIDERISGLEVLAEFDNDIAYISLMAGNDGNKVFLISLNKESSSHRGLLEVYGNGHACLYLISTVVSSHQHFIINNSLMLLYAMFTSTLGTLLIHASVVVNDGKGYAFLGCSGTGKSTHSRLWLRYISGSAILNDDNPIIRIENGVAMIYGSPWSGKTPCYKNVCVPLKSIVRLSQAPYNKINALTGVSAYALVAPSASSMKWDKIIADGQHRTFAGLINLVGTYYLKCLPDKVAAELCFKTVG